MSDFYQSFSIGEGAYRFTSTENVFFELLVGTEKALVIDTGYGFADIKKAVRRITDKQLTVVNTHGHVDHTCGNNWFDQEEIYICEKDMELMQKHNSREMRRQSAELAKHTMDWASGKEIYGLPEDFDEEKYIAADTRRQYHFLKDGMIFDLGGKTVRTIATPGHTKGSMSFLYEEENWLYVGDEANVFLWLFDKYAAGRSTHIATLEKILELAPERIYGGHAPDFYTTDDVKTFIRAAKEADYESGIPFSTPLMPDCKDIRVCILDGRTMQEIGTPGFCAILLDPANAGI